MFKRLKRRVAALESKLDGGVCWSGSLRIEYGGVVPMMNELNLICSEFEKSSSRFLLKKDGAWKIYKRGEKDECYS